MLLSMGQVIMNDCNDCVHICLWVAYGCDYHTQRVFTKHMYALALEVTLLLAPLHFSRLLLNLQAQNS